MAYENGMSIQHDAINRRVIIHFRGKKHEIKAPGDDRAQAIRAGEEFCRQLGWTD